MSRFYEDFDLPEDLRKKLHDAFYNIDDKKKFEEYKNKVFLYFELECGHKIIDLADYNLKIIFDHFKSGDSPNNCAMVLYSTNWA